VIISFQGSDGKVTTQNKIKPKALMAWSSGKDSAYALHRARLDDQVEITGLLTTVTDAYNRVSMHGVREEILDLQAKRVGLPLTKVRIPAPCPNEIYERAMADALELHRENGVTGVIFGDLFLEDLRQWRESRLAEVGMTGIFPLWTSNTPDLAREMIDSGMEATIACLDPRVMPLEFAGAAFDHTLLAALPQGVDPCGENGEFHTVVTNGPMFSNKINTQAGETVEREGFVFTDILLA
jgi:uncharacterized protein (TIGR00290 family)